MSLAVRRASPVDDRQEMLEILARHWGPAQHERFDWCHMGNPAGESWTFFIYDKNTNATVAMASVFPRNMFIDGKLHRCGQVGEFAVEATHRSLGPAVMMQRATFEPVDSGALAMCYDCPPHDQGMSTFVRLGMSPNCEGFRYTLPLRGEEYIARSLGTGAWTRPVIVATNLILRTRLARRKDSDLEVSKLHDRFPKEFSNLDARVGSSSAIRASRSADLLNWRFIDNPASNCHVLVARQAGEIVAFLAFRIERGRAHILDLFGLRIADTGPALLDAALDVCKQSRAWALSGICSEGSALNSLFTSFRFRKREREARVVAYEKPGFLPEKLLSSTLRWDFSCFELTQ